MLNMTVGAKTNPVKPLSIIILNFFYLLCFRAVLKKLPIMLNIMLINTAIMSQFIYNFIIFNNYID